MIYVITSGKYSDYRVLMATTNKEYALKFVAEYNRDDNTYYEAKIQEYEDRAITNLISYGCWFLKGELNKIEIDKDYTSNIHYDEVRQFGYCRLLAENRDEAIKIAAERMAKYRMENKK